MSTPDYKYSAFISYSRKEAAETGQNWEEWVQNLIESYQIPPSFVGVESEMFGDTVPEEMLGVFLDKERISASGNLTTILYPALEKSRVLIVLCSPNSAQSVWVEPEVRYFKSLGRGQRIVAIIVRGEPYAKNPSNECHPESLRYELVDGKPDSSKEAHPVYIDLRGPDNTPGATSVAAYREKLELKDRYSLKGINDLAAAYELTLEKARKEIIRGVMGISPEVFEEKHKRAEEEAAAAELEEACKRVEEAEARAQTEAALRHLAETARTEATIAQHTAQLARRKAIHRSKLAVTAATLSVCAAVFAYIQWKRAENKEADAKSALVDADDAKASAISEKVLADLATTRALKSETDALAATAKATEARAAAQELTNSMVYELGDRLTGLGRMDLVKTIHDRIADYDKRFPLNQRERSVLIFMRGDIEKAAGYTARKTGQSKEADKWYDKALATYEEAQKIRVQLHETNKNNRDYLRLVGTGIDKIGALEMERAVLPNQPKETVKRYRDAALASFERCQDIYLRLVLFNESDMTTQLYIANSDVRIADLLLKTTLSGSDLSAAARRIRFGRDRLGRIQTLIPKETVWYFNDVQVYLQSVSDLSGHLEKQKELQSKLPKGQ
jgi:hypothetical protein